MSFTQQRLPSGQPAIKLRLVESCSHGWPSGTYSHLHTESMEISQSDYWVSHLELLQPKLFSVFLRTALKQVLVGSNFFLPFRSVGSRSAPRNFQECQNQINLPTSVPLKFDLWALVEGGLTSHFGLWWHCQQWDLLQVCIFKKKSRLISWTHNSCNVPAKGPTIWAKAIFQDFFFH